MIKQLNLDNLLKYIFIIFYIFTLLFFFYYFYLSLCSVNNSLQILAVITASILASTAMIRTYIQNEKNIKNTEKLKIEEQKNKKYMELFYQQLVLITIRETFEGVRKNIKQNRFYSNNGFEQLQKSLKELISKIDSKDFFHYLSKNKAGELMNIKARLGSIINLIDNYLISGDEQKFKEAILEELETHKILPLFPTIYNFIEYISKEIDGIKN